MLSKLLQAIVLFFTFSKSKPKAPLPLPPSEELDKGRWPIFQLALADGSGYQFSISDGFGRNKRRGKGHLGADLARRRLTKGIWKRPEYSPWYYCPSNLVHAVACAGGEVIRITTDGNGTAVYLKHGRYMTVYRHLNGVYVTKGTHLGMGDFIGIVSHAPKNRPKVFNHLHFEVWDTTLRGDAGVWNRGRQAIDPAPFLKRWARF